MKIVKKALPVSWLYDSYTRIDMSPYYQRESQVWSKEKKQLLIDSIFNHYDIPKIYLHIRPNNIISYADVNTKYEYSVIDGKQRISAIIEFICDGFTLPKDIELNNNQFSFIDNELSIKNMRFSDISTMYPFLISEFMNYTLDFIIIDTDDPTIIEDMFLRLNAGVHLNSAEKRIAAGRQLTEAIKTKLVSHSFFKDKIAFNDSRGTFFDVALKLLVLEHNKTVSDLSSKSLDLFIKNNNNFKNSQIQSALYHLIKNLDILSEVFRDKDKLLATKNVIPLFYLLIMDKKLNNLREFIESFNALKARVLKDEDTSSRDYAKLSEFNLYSQQGADQKGKLEQRYRIISEYYEKYTSIHI